MRKSNMRDGNATIEPIHRYTYNNNNNYTPNTAAREWLGAGYNIYKTLNYFFIFSAIDFHYGSFNSPPNPSYYLFIYTYFFFYKLIWLFLYNRAYIIWTLAWMWILNLSRSTYYTYILCN